MAGICLVRIPDARASRSVIVSEAMASTRTAAGDEPPPYIQPIQSSALRAIGNVGRGLIRCRKGKRRGPSARAFELDAERECLAFAQELVG